MHARAAALVHGTRGRSSGWDPPAPRDAATVCVVREGPSGPEVFLMRRPPTMAFAARMYVFPGGAVEPVDAELPFVDGGDLGALARRAATSAPRALLAAAVRETFEECGVLLAVDRDGAVTSGWDGAERDRAALDEGRLSLADLLRLRGLALDPRLLPLVGHWVTPEVEDRRFDTRFFLAALPAGQQAYRTGAESDAAGWWTPAAALAAHAAGELAMLAPTTATLGWLQSCRTVQELFAAAASVAVRPLMPAPRSAGTDGVRWVMTDARTGEELSAADTSVTAVGGLGLGADGPRASEVEGAR